MNRGWFKLYRKLLESPVFHNPTALQLFIYLMSEASVKPREFYTGDGQFIDLEPGAVVVGRCGLSKTLRTTERKVRTALGFLEKLNIIKRKPTNRFTVVTILNWGIYQAQFTPDDQQTTSQRPADDQPTTSQRPANDQQTTTALRKKNLEREKEEVREDSSRCPNHFNSHEISLEEKVRLESQGVQKKWLNVCNRWKFSKQGVNGKSIRDSLLLYVENAKDLNRVYAAIDMLLHNEPLKFHTENASGYWSLAWLLKTKDSKSNPVDRIQQVIDGSMFERNSRDIETEEQSLYTPEEQRQHLCDRFGNAKASEEFQGFDNMEVCN